MPINTNKENINFQITRGDTAIKDFEFLDKDGNPYNLAGFTITAQGRQTVNSAAPLFSLTISNGGENDFINGKLVLRVPSTTTANFPPQLVYDIQAVSSDLTITIARGYINVIPDITRP